MTFERTCPIPGCGQPAPADTICPGCELAATRKLFDDVHDPDRHYTDHFPRSRYI